MKILFVHGMGATPLDALPTLMRLGKLGYRTSTFSYFSSFQTLDAIRARLQRRLAALADGGEYALIGHSLGGVLLRDALSSLPDEIRRPGHLFLVGSPILATRTNGYFNRYALYKMLSGQCGQLVASQEQMRAIGMPSLPTTCVVGSKGLTGRRSPFGTEANDSIVLESELCPQLFSDVVHIAARHPMLPSHRDLAPIVHQRLAAIRRPDAA